MLDGLVLQVVLGAVWIVTATIAIVWYIVGITRKSAVVIIAVLVPVVVCVAVLLCVITA